MKIFLASDIHTEHSNSSFDPALYYEQLDFDYPDDADVVVLAGDIGEWINGIEWARHRFKNKEIIYVAGNHEYYDCDLSIIDEMRLKAKELDIHFLENDAVIINNVRFLGCTLWTDFNRYSHTEIAKSWSEMSDFKYIRCVDWWANSINRERALSLTELDSQYGSDPDLFSPTVAYLLHRKSIEWLSNMFNKVHNGKTVVVTHHCPTMRHTSNSAYGSNLEKFISNRANKIDLWLHGHIHQSVDYEVAGVRIASNPRGYPSDHHLNKNFSEEKLLCL